MAVAGKKIVIFGASGFVAANFFKYISKKNRIHKLFLATGKKNWRFSKEELTRAALIKNVDIANKPEVVSFINTIKPHVVINFAAKGVSGEDSNWAKLAKTNISGVLNIMSALEKNPTQRMIQIGSCFEYGTSQHNMKETDALNPQTIYSASKAAGSLLALSVGKKIDIPTTIIRPFTLYGPWDNGFRLIPWTILSILRGERQIKLTTGKKDQVKDFLFIEDLLDVLNNLVDTNSRSVSHQIINIGHNTAMSVEKLIHLIASLMSTKVKIVTVDENKLPFKARKTEYSRIVSDIHKAKTLLGYQPMFSLEKGLKKTIRWFRANRTFYD